MADNLPLLPEKGVSVCADVRRVLREVFRELDHCAPSDADAGPTEGGCWTKESSTDHNKLHQQEWELQQEYAKRLSREPLPNIYQLRSPVVSAEDVTKKTEPIILMRKDLKPSVDQDAGGDQSLWVQNTLNKSSGDLGALRVVGSRVNLPVTLEAAELDTVYSFSIGDLLPRASLPPTPPAPQPLEPTYIMCIPPRLDFVNFTIGRLHTRTIRLVNVSKFEVRVSVRPPARRELHVELCSRLAVTAGAHAELRVRFRASDVRALTDALLLRVSAGRALTVPIACYMEPPQLHITIPNAPMLCVSAAQGAASQHTHTVELGARLVGDVHRVPLLLRCAAAHARFFLLSDDSWTHCSLQVTAGMSRARGIPTECFYVSPARWAGGGATRGLAVCRAPAPGLHAAALRVVSSTAIVRPLSLIADAMMYSPDHVTIQAHEKDYDICSEDDPACQYYVNLGVAFPNRSLAATVTIINHSPLVYRYYWSARAWGACSCWQESAEREDDALCTGAREARDKTLQGGAPLRAETEEARQLVRVSAASGCLCPRSETAARVCVPDVGALLHTRRAVLMLILKNVPEESFPANYDPMIVKTSEIEEKCIPGVCPKWSRRVCDVVCAQLEVWWRVVPVRFALHPPLLLLPHSRRVKSAAVSLRCTQVYGDSSITAKWRHLSPAPPPLALPPQQSVLSTVVLPLHELPNQFPHSHVIQLVAESEEWSSSCRIERWCSTRHPALRPAAVWLGVQPPGAPVAAQLTVLNDTHQHICWWATVHRWCRARGAAPACAARAPCAACCSRACACDALAPARGALDHSQTIQLRYCVNAPDSDGCVATVVQLQRTAADVARVCSGRGVDARATLLAYRVLAPRLVLRVLPCRGDKARACEGCALEPGCSALGGSPVLRPSGALSLGGRSCCRLQITNTTPLPTTVHWSPAIEGEDILAVTFIPNEFKVGGHSTVEVLAVLEARRAHARRLWVREARVQHAYKPLYLVIDAAISGVEVVVEVPTGGDENTDSFVKIPMTQPERPARGELTVEQMFAQDDCKRALQRENICHCHYKMIYIPPAPTSAPGAEERGEYSPVSILEEPPPLTRVCPCSGSTRPVLPEDTEPYCLQFQHLPIRTVRSRTLVLHNVSRLDAQWTAAVRRWPRKRDRTVDTAPGAQWARSVHASGAALQCEPRGGRLAARARAPVAVSVYADCWGLYRDQILIQLPPKVEGLSPLVLDVWVEAEGAPLEFPLRSAHSAHPAHTAQHPPTLWMSSSDAERAVRVTNTSRADLTVDVYLLRENEYPQDELPFRLYLRFFDVPPRICPCVTAFESNTKLEDESPRSASSVYKEMDTDIEIYLGPDYGVQCTEDFYQVEPVRLSARAGESAALAVLRRRRQSAPHHVLLLRCTPRLTAGVGWCRAPPPPQPLQLRQAARGALLQALTAELRVAVCALDLPHNDVLRVRKKFRIQNIGEGPLEAVAATEAPWRVEFSRDVCAAHCVRVDRSHLFEDLQLKLAPRTSMELFAEVSLKAEQLWPPPGAAYPPRVTTTTSLNFYDQDKVLLLSLPLVLELELPVLRVEPAALDFGFVSDGSSRKAYFTVSHSSLSDVDLVTQWEGAAQFRLYPPLFSLRPGASARVYVQYTARWESDRISEGAACVSACGAARAWCRASVRVSARAARPRPLRAPAHVDHTDDPHLLPPHTC